MRRGFQGSCDQHDAIKAEEDRLGKLTCKAAKQPAYGLIAVKKNSQTIGSKSTPMFDLGRLFHLADLQCSSSKREECIVHPSSLEKAKGQAHRLS